MVLLHQCAYPSFRLPRILVQSTRGASLLNLGKESCWRLAERNFCFFCLCVFSSCNPAPSLEVPSIGVSIPNKRLLSSVNFCSCGQRTLCGKNCNLSNLFFCDFFESADSQITKYALQIFRNNILASKRKREMAQQPTRNQKAKDSLFFPFLAGKGRMELIRLFATVCNETFLLC